MTCFELHGRLYSVAGEGPDSGAFSRSVYRYDPQAGQWTTLNDFPITSWMAMATVCNGKAYVMGGRRGYGATCAEVYEYNEATDAWRACAPMPVPVMFAGAAACEGKAYVFGGAFKSSESQHHYTNMVQVFDPAANSWTLQSMPVLLSPAVAAVTCGNLIYIFALKIWDTELAAWQDNTMICCYSPDTGRWSGLELGTPVGSYQNQPPANINGTAYFLADNTLVPRAWKLLLPTDPSQPGLSRRLVAPTATVP